MQTSSQTDTRPIDGAAAHSTSRIAQALGALLLGLLVVGVAGFSHIDAVHNASHDTRHSNAFPCH
jgi:cobalt transporter subunit CbtB